MLALKTKCSLCGKDRDQVRELITGTGGNICDVCVGDYNALAGKIPDPLGAGVAATQCRFCEDQPGFVEQRLSDGASVSICRECLKLCNQIVCKKPVMLVQKKDRQYQ